MDGSGHPDPPRGPARNEEVRPEVRRAGDVSLCLDVILSACRPLSEAGAALHWLRSQSKAPVEDAWSSAPVYSLQELIDRHRAGYNVGIRLGHPSATAYGYLHVIDLDIRSDEVAEEAWAALLKMLPTARELPSVVSGSGGNSRHLYFFSKNALKSRKIAKSEAFSMVFDPKKGREVKKRHWEIDLFGTGKQVVLPPSIHPDTGQPYRWEWEIDWDLADLGIVPTVDADRLGAEAADEVDLDDEDDLFAIVRTQPLDLTDEEVDRYLADLPEEWVEDRDTWLQVGQALSHQYQGGEVGFEKWCEWSRQSPKFKLRDSKIVWRSFKGDRNPVTMRTVIQAANETRLHSNLPAIVAEDQPPAEVDPLDELLGTPIPTPVKVNPIAEWTSLMARNEEGHPTGCLHNARLIPLHDVRTYGCIGFNDFKNSIVLLNTPKQAVRDREQVKKPMVQLTGDDWTVLPNQRADGKNWTDTHMNGLRLMIEAPKAQGGYGIKITDRDLRAGVDLAAKENRFHPVKLRLMSCHDLWKARGGQRMDTLFIDYLGCADTPYHREAARLLLLGAVTRVFEPGHKFDFVPILEGVQGKRKSTFISVLGLNWSSELAGDFHDNQAMVEQIIGSWIIEIPELQGFSKADTNYLKAFLSRTWDKTRLAYRTNAEEFPRQCVFIGSTNDDEYLRDHTGGRRFWPIKCELEGEIDTDRLRGEIDLIWGEAVAAYFAMRETCKLQYLPLFLTSDEAREEAKALQESRRVETVADTLAGEIQKWLDDPIGADSGFDDLDPDAPKVYRNETCAAQIWHEMMGKPKGSMPQNESMKIGHALARVSGWTRQRQRTTRNYGPQRTYIRVGTRGDAAL